jgi:hypothetical protein
VKHMLAATVLAIAFAVGLAATAVAGGPRASCMGQFSSDAGQAGKRDDAAHAIKAATSPPGAFYTDIARSPTRPSSGEEEECEEVEPG